MLFAFASLRRALVTILVAAALSASAAPAIFVASHPGAPLAPADEHASAAIQLVQGGDSILWASKKAEVATVTTYGWQSSDDDNELGGVMLLEAVYRTTGTTSIGEAPRMVEFRFDS